MSHPGLYFLDAPDWQPDGDFCWVAAVSWNYSTSLDDLPIVVLLMLHGY